MEYCHTGFMLNFPYSNIKKTLEKYSNTRLLEKFCVYG